MTELGINGGPDGFSLYIIVTKYLRDITVNF